MSATSDVRSFQTRWRDGLAALVCPQLEEAGFQNAFSTRMGGVSPMPGAALNLSLREDAKENVKENRRRFLMSIGAPSVPLLTARQTHSTDVKIITDIDSALKQEPECDAMISHVEGCLFGVQSADCLPILIADPVTKWMAVIHAGWRGTMDGIVKKTIDLLKEKGVKPASCLAAVGPCACGDCYEVGADVVAAFEERGWDIDEVFRRIQPTGKAFLDVQAANCHALKKAGLSDENIHVAKNCTIHENTLFFSYRLESKGGALPVGRQLAVIGRR
jgi:YfiH family protein